MKIKNHVLYIYKEMHREDIVYSDRGKLNTTFFSFFNLKIINLKSRGTGNLSTTFCRFSWAWILGYCLLPRFFTQKQNNFLPRQNTGEITLGIRQ